MQTDNILLALTQQVNPEAVRAYAKARGWVSVESRRSIYLLRHPTETLRQIQIPLDKKNSDFAETILEMARRLQEDERCLIEDIVKDFLAFNESNSPRQNFVGYVEKLMGDWDDQIQERTGKVLLKLMHDDSVLTASASLSSEEHQLAIHAYEKNRNITIQGILRRTGRMNYIFDHSDFKTVD